MTEKQIALVTGGSRGIGRAVAVALAESGRHVLVNYRSSEADAKETQEQIDRLGGSSELVRFDVTEGDSTARTIEGILAEYGHIDILVNNAGITRDMLLIWMNEEDWQSVLDVKLSGFYHVTTPIVKAMLHRRSGTIVNIASTSGQLGTSGQVNYSAANAGLIGATKALAREVARRGIRVNAVAPGFIETDMLAGLDPKELARNVPMRRLGRVEEVAAAVRFLCGEDASYITGQVIGVNGGIC